MTNKSSIQTQKEYAVDFLNLLMSGNINEAYESYVNMHGRHHNVYYASDFLSLKQGMIENQAQFPNKRLMVKNVLGDGNLVAVHSNIIMKEGEPGLSVVHLFRFENGKIVEMWDVGQALPVNSPNLIGAF
jgi:predicted SnoaL-like aldol condensation-catalyzing enzyme